MLTAIEDVDVVVPVHADTADFLKRPAGREFRPVLHRFVFVFTVAHGSHGQESLLLSLAELVTKRRLRPGRVLGKALPAKGVRLPICGSSGWNRVSGIIERRESANYGCVTRMAHRVSWRRISTRTAQKISLQSIQNRRPPAAYEAT